MPGSLCCLLRRADSGNAAAWGWGPARATGAGTASGTIRAVERKLYLRILSTTLALVPLAIAAFAFFILVHYESTGNLLGFLPSNAKHWVEEAAGVPAAQPGEGTRWRLEGFTAFVRNAVMDRRIVLALAAIGVVLTVIVYRLERRAVAGFRRLVVPTLFGLAAILLALFVILPQLRLAFDREGWPEVVILIDTSASMSTMDNLKDPAVRAKAQELLGAAGLPQAQRLKLAQASAHASRMPIGWIGSFTRRKSRFTFMPWTRRRVRSFHSINRRFRRWPRALMKLTAEGDSSRLGEGVESVLKAFQGGSLAAIIMLTDGVTTAGDDLPKAAREASRAGVPLFLVGVGDAWEPPDLELTDLQVEDTVTVGDRVGVRCPVDDSRTSSQLIRYR